MFVKKAPQHAVSSDGFEVSAPGFNHLLYTEHIPNGGSRSAKVFAELMMGRNTYEIDARPGFLDHWNAPHEGEKIEEADRKRIVKNLKDALDFLGITYIARE